MQSKWSLMAVLHYDLTPKNCHELINLKIRGNSCIFVSIRDFLRFSNDTDTIVLRMFDGIGWNRLESHEYWLDSITIYKNILGNTARRLGS